MCISVAGGYTTSPTNLHMWDYTQAQEQGWYLVPADNRKIGELRLFVTDHTTASSTPHLMRGHSFISILNTSNYRIPMGALEILPGVEMSFGSWDLENHSGIIYNLETSKVSEQQYYINICADLRGCDLAGLNNYIAENDYWEWHNNCTYFAINMWNKLSTAPIKFTTLAGDLAVETPFVLKQVILGSGLPVEEARSMPRVTPIGFVENGAFVDRSAYNPET